MLKKERQTFILHQVYLHNKVLSVDLSQEMNVSEDTIRGDLNEMSGNNQLIKVHGGALSKSFHLSIHSNHVNALNGKKTIAIELAKSIPPELSATFITISLPATYEYIHHPNIEVIFIGDRISRNAQISIGGEAISKIRSTRADTCSWERMPSI